MEYQSYQSIDSSTSSTSPSQGPYLQPVQVVPSTNPMKVNLGDYPSEQYIYGIPTTITQSEERKRKLGERSQEDKRMKLSDMNVVNLLCQLKRKPIQKDDSIPCSLELSCLKNISDSTERSNRIHLHLQNVLNKKESNSGILREVTKLMNNYLTRVEKTVKKEEKMVEEECQTVMNGLLRKAEQYVNGELYCHCFQPYVSSRYFIQCDECTMWYHTSCVGIDSRKLPSISTFTCSWCLREKSSQGEVKEVDIQEPQEAQEAQEVQEVICTCPYCNRLFSRPCNLSRHLHSKHNIKWETHQVIHSDHKNDYLEIKLPGKSLRDASKRELFKGCFMVEKATKEYQMTVPQFRFLLRQIRGKPSVWWRGRELRLWNEEKKEYELVIIKTTRPRNEFCIQHESGVVSIISNLFDPALKIRLLIISGYFELELYHALPQPYVRDTSRDLERFF